MIWIMWIFGICDKEFGYFCIALMGERDEMDSRKNYNRDNI